MTHEEELVERAQRGDRAALSELLKAMKDLVYNLAIRMLGNPADAEDATQEILIRLVTNLTSFRGESAFRTWVYRVASNHLLTARTRRADERTESFEAMALQLEKNLADDLPPLEDQLLVTEAKLRCTSGMLQCLDRDHRLSFILGEILELDNVEAAAVLEIEPDAFRKRLSRARSRMAEFMRDTCGLVNPALPCRCAKQAAHAVQVGYLDRTKVAFANHPVLREAQLAGVEAVDDLTRAVAVFRSHPRYAAPGSVVERLKELLVQGGGVLD